jgi:hypothetical protein
MIGAFAVVKGTFIKIGNSYSFIKAVPKIYPYFDLKIKLSNVLAYFKNCSVNFDVFSTLSNTFPKPTES